MFLMCFQISQQMEKLARIMMINGWHKIHMYRQYKNNNKTLNKIGELPFMYPMYPMCILFNIIIWFIF